MVLRPVIFAISNLMTQVVVTPAIAPLVIMRLHRWMLGQSVDFFDNDWRHPYLTEQFAQDIQQIQEQQSASEVDHSLV